MRHFLKWVILLIFLIGCSKKLPQTEWFLIGDNIKLFLDLEIEKKLRLTQENNLVFEAGIRDFEFVEKNKLRVDLTMLQIGEKPEYKIKYKELTDFVIWFEIGQDSLKMIFTKFYNKPYFFSSKPIVYQIPARFLSSFEIEEFKNQFDDLRKDNLVEVLINKTPLLTPEQVIAEEKKAIREWLKEKYGLKNTVIRNMTDYMLDKDPSTYWATENFFGTEIEFIIKDLYGKNLSKPVRIRGIYFNTGNLDNKNNYHQFHRIKDVEIYFSTEYEGSLVSSQANYNYVNYRVTLSDKMEEKVLVFLEPIKANSIRFAFKDFYLGTTNVFAIFDIIVFVDK